MKNKKKIEGIFIGASAILIILFTTLGVIQIFKFVQIKTTEAKNGAVSWLAMPMSDYKVNVPKKQEVIEPTMKEWVKQEIDNVGLNWEEVDCLIFNESGWDNWKYGINENGSTDMGLWQINSIHKNTCSVECRWDYKCSTHWAIQKRLNDGNWDSWYGYKHNCK